MLHTILYVIKMRKLSEKIIKKVKTLRRRGYSYKDISKIVKVSVGSVYNYAYKLKLTKEAKKRLMTKMNKGKKRRHITKPSKLNKKLIRIMGHCFFDGSVNIDGIRYTNVSRELINQFAHDVKSVFKINPSNIISSKKKHECFTVCFNYRELADFLFSFTKSYSTSSKECEIPEIVFNSSSNEICEFLRTFWEDEGCIKSDGTICGKIKSRKIANQLLLLHKLIGIETYLRKDITNEAYEIIVKRNVKNLKNFINLVGFKNSLVCRGKYSNMKKLEVFNIIYGNKVKSPSSSVG